MAFILAHPAVVLPLARWKLSLSALIVGSLAPDLFKMLPIADKLNVHSWLGILWFCLPVGLISLLFFHWFFKKPFFLLLPQNHQERLLPFLDRFAILPASRFGAVLLSLALGACTHLAWDEFCYSGSTLAQHWPFLTENGFVLGGYFFAPYKVIRYLTTLVGVVALPYAYYRFYRSAPKHSLNSIFTLPGKMKVVFFSFTSVAAVGVGAIYAALATEEEQHHQLWMENFLLRAAISIGVVFIMEMLAFCLLFIFWMKERGEKENPES